MRSEIYFNWRLPVIRWGEIESLVPMADRLLYPKGMVVKIKFGKYRQYRNIEIQNRHDHTIVTDFLGTTRECYVFIRSLITSLTLPELEATDDKKKMA